MVEIPKEHYFVYGGVVARQFPWWIVGLVATAFLLVAVRRFLGKVLRGFALPLAVLLLLALLWLGHRAGTAAALDQYQQQRISDYRAYPRVQIWPAEGGSPLPNASPREDLARGCYRLVLHNQDRLFLIRPFKGASVADLPVLILRQDEISMIQVLPDYTSCR